MANRKLIRGAGRVDMGAARLKPDVATVPAECYWRGWLVQGYG